MNHTMVRKQFKELSRGSDQNSAVSCCRPVEQRKWALGVLIAHGEYLNMEKNFSHNEKNGPFLTWSEMTILWIPEPGRKSGKRETEMEALG